MSDGAASEKRNSQDCPGPRPDSRWCLRQGLCNIMMSADRLPRLTATITWPRFNSHAVRIYTASAVRTGVVLAQPRLDAVEMEPMFAMQHCHLCVEFHGLHANRTLRLPICPHHLRRHFLLRQRTNRSFCSWGRSCALLGVVDHLRYDPIKLFLRIHSIAIAIKVQYGREHCERALAKRVCVSWHVCTKSGSASLGLTSSF